jgi:hypothetical protein
VVGGSLSYRRPFDARAFTGLDRNRMSERPGPHIGEPKREHQVIAMLYLLSTAPSKEEATRFLQGLEWVVTRQWGWNPIRLKDELVQAEKIMKEYRGRMTFWFTEKGMEFERRRNEKEKMM